MIEIQESDARQDAESVLSLLSSEMLNGKLDQLGFADFFVAGMTWESIRRDLERGYVCGHAFSVPVCSIRFVEAMLRRMNLEYGVHVERQFPAFDPNGGLSHPNPVVRYVVLSPAPKLESSCAFPESFFLSRGFNRLEPSIWPTWVHGKLNSPDCVQICIQAWGQVTSRVILFFGEREVFYPEIITNGSELDRVLSEQFQIRPL